MNKINKNKVLICMAVISLWSTSNYSPVLAARSDQKNEAWQSSSILFAVIGDYGLAGQPEADVAALVKSWKPHFIVTVGDNNYPKGSADSIDQNVGQYYHDYIYPYKGTYGNGSATKRFFPVLGNHDWESNPNVYFNYFSFFNQRGYYEFIQGPIHFFMLDSDTREPDGTSSTSKQAKWLKNALATSTSTFNVVVLHHAPYSSGAHGSTVYMQWPYKDWGADVVLAGHDHIYERLLVNQLPYFVNGIGGAELYKFETILPESQIRFNADFGAMRVEATNTTMKFQMFTRTGALVDEYIIGQTTPLVSSITRVHASPTNAATVDFLATFSEPVTGVDVSDFLLSTNNINDAFIANVNGSGNSYTITVNSGSTSGAFQLTLTDNDSIIGLTGNPLGGNGAGNGNFTSNDSYVMEKTPPSILSITRVNASPTNAFSVDYSVSFSEPVTGVDGGDFSLFSSSPSGAYISNVTGSGSLYTVSVSTGSGDTTLRLDMIDNDSIMDAIGNTTNGGFSSGELYTIDKSTPTVTSIIRTAAQGTNAAAVDFIVTFSEPVNGLDATDFALTTSGLNGAFISNITNSNPFYVVTVNTGSGDGSIRLDLIDDDTIVNGFGTSIGNAGMGNGNFSSGETYTVDKTAPIVTSIQRASTNPTMASSVDFIVTFSEQVNGVDAADFISTSTNISGSFIGNITSANPFYVVSINTGTGTGSLRLDLADNDTIMDAFGNPLGGFGAGNGNFVSGETFNVNKEAVNFPSPTLLEPRRNLLTNNSQPAFSWTIVRNARAYEIVIAMDENFSQIVLSQSMDRPSFSSFTPFKDGLYFWKVRAYNPDLLPGKYSTAQVFTVDKTPPSPPTVASPANHSSTLKRPWLQWSSASDAIQFQVEVDNRSDFINPEFRGTTNNLYIRAENLSKGTYYWRIKGKDSAGNWGPWSMIFSFRIP
jgi:tartrate-resistant acid phosphatase type 5